MLMMGELSFFLGLQVKQSKDGIFLSHSKYFKEILKKFEMEKCKKATTPLSTSCYMDADATGTTVVQAKYRGLIGSLLYLTANRPDIMFTVCLYARFQPNPKESHLKAAKRILKYLKLKWTWRPIIKRKKRWRLKWRTPMEVKAHLKGLQEACSKL